MRQIVDPPPVLTHTASEHSEWPFGREVSKKQIPRCDLRHDLCGLSVYRMGSLGRNLRLRPSAQSLGQRYHWKVSPAPNDLVSEKDLSSLYAMLNIAHTLSRFINAGINIATEICTVAIPIPVLCNLRIPKRQKRILLVRS